MSERQETALRATVLGVSVGVVVSAWFQTTAIITTILLIALPLAIFAALSILDASEIAFKRTAEEARRAPPQRRVIRVSRALYERVDPEVLQMLLSERDFNGNDYERLVQLDALNEPAPSHAASDADVQRLPLVVITEQMRHAADHASCAICLVDYEVGTTVRMMPCFHYFHPACIDRWLKDCAICPVCKFPAIA